MTRNKKPIQLDGRTGEGGGQLVRIACALAAVTSQPVRIFHVRGNREGARGGGKFRHGWRNFHRERTTCSNLS